MKHRVLLLFIASLLLSFGSSAESIYKTTDENGQVSYSSTPPTTHQNSVKMAIPPPPSDEAVNAAKERHQQNIRTEKILNDMRQEREQKIAEDNRIKRENAELAAPLPKYKEPKEEGPYYGIPGRGILVLPKGPRINR